MCIHSIVLFYIATNLLKRLLPPSHFKPHPLFTCSLSIYWGNYGGVSETEKTCDVDCLHLKLYIWMTTRWCGAAASSELQLWPFFFFSFFYHEESKTSHLSITWGITCRRLVYFVWTSWMRLLYLLLLNVIVRVDYLFV